ncbi:MAG: MFS transporter [Kiritimatiellia bacterium]|nr:MFS transporter [Kiritimatiellia bacterium]
MIAWKRNIIFILAAQFFSMTAFSFAMPFVPFYLQEMGVREAHKLKIWIALFNFAAPLTLAIFSPIWGAVGDRYGRRLMLLRANFGSVIILLLMGMATSPTMLIGLRLFQGVLSGTMPAALTLVSVHAPQNRSGFALGLLSAAVASGNTIGAFLGGLFAELFGYRMAFVAGSGLMLVAGLLVLFGTEEYVSKRQEENERPQKFHLAPRNLGSAGFILFLISVIGFVITFDMGWLPLLVQEIHGGLRGVSFWSGSLVAVGGIAGFIAGPIIGRLADRITPPTIARISAIGSGSMTILVALSHHFPLLFCARFCTAFFAGGLDPVFQIWLSKVTPERERGVVFGWASSVRAIGWMCSPLVSGAVAWLAGVRAIFFAAAGFYFLLVPLISFIVRRLEKNAVKN